MKWLFIVVLVCVLPSNGFAQLGLGILGYVPYGPSTQKEEDGATNSLKLHPGISVSYIYPFSGANLFMPELGYVKHSTEGSTYDKSTIYLLYDFGFRFSPKLALRYGLGTFITKISSDGAAITLNNGASTAVFYKPNESVSSYNTTVNIGVELLLAPNIGSRIEVFVSEILSSEKRKASYFLEFIYYL